MAHQRVSQLGRATSFSKFYPRVAHKRINQVEMATSFSKFYPWVAHQRVRQLGMTTSFSKFYRKRRYAGVVFTRFCDLWFSVFFENVSCFEERV